MQYLEPTNNEYKIHWVSYILSVSLICLLDSTDLDTCYSDCGLRTSRIGFAWELIRNAASQASPIATEPESSV